jgi:uncharacterized membrane protein YphA (DoxX/SURF4 family)
MANDSASTKWPLYGMWALQILAGAAFFAAGTGKLLGAEQMVQLYDNIGIGQWFRYVTGLIEVGGAILLLVPRLAVYGALLLICVMIGAIITHLFIVGGSAVPALVLLAILAAVVWLRRHEIPRLN